MRLCSHNKGSFLQEYKSFLILNFLKPVYVYSFQRVEMASEFAVSEVFSQQKYTYNVKRSPAVALQSMEQLQDHDEAYSEGRTTSRFVLILYFQIIQLLILKGFSRLLRG